jgi:hypothetical protein
MTRLVEGPSLCALFLSIACLAAGCGSDDPGRPDVARPPAVADAGPETGLDVAPASGCANACPLACLTGLTEGCAPADGLVSRYDNPQVSATTYGNGVLVEVGGPFVRAGSTLTVSGVQIFKNGRLCYQIVQSPIPGGLELGFYTSGGVQVATGHVEMGRLLVTCGPDSADVTDTACPGAEGPPYCPVTPALTTAR